MAKSPKLRFKGTNGEQYSSWMTVRLRDILVSRDERQVPSEEAPLMAFTSTGGVEDKGDRYNREFLVKDKNKKYKRTEFNDLIYSSNNLDVGAIGRNKYGTAVISDVYEIFKTRQNVIPEFMELLIKQKRFLNSVLKFRQGALYGQYRIHADDFLNVEADIPTFGEQQRIASFFSLFDRKIKKQQEKIEQLEQFKKGMLQKIFSQEVRFKDENGKEFPEWEQVLIGDILKIRHGKSQKQIEDPEGKYPILATGGEIGRTNTPIYSKPTVLIGRKGTINKPQYMDEPFWTVDTLFFSEISNTVNPKFVYYLFHQINWLMYNEASGVPSLSAATIESIACEIPSAVNEQIKIAEFLSTIDRKLENEQRKLDCYSEKKKYYLSNMLV